MPICLLLGQNGIVSAQETFDESAIYQRMYRLLAQPGEDPNGATDISYIDQGTSDFIRNLFWLNDGAADNAVCGWGDAGLHEIITNTWDHTLPQLDGMFQRLALDIYTCNFYLENAPESQTQRRAEAKFLRALCYYYMLDLFGSVPISTSTVSSILSQRDFWRRLGYNTQREVLPQNSREEVFNFVESELLACAGDLAAPGTATYGHADRAAAWFLLARLYLNAEVYTGTARWAEAQSYAETVCNGPHKLNTTGMNGWSAYQMLFMGDNGETSAATEAIFPVLQDGTTTTSWGTSLFLMASTWKSDMNINSDFGTTEFWAGNRARRQLLDKFFPNGDAPNATYEDMAAAAGDDRAIFFGVDRELSVSTPTEYTSGFACAKFRNTYASGGTPHNTQYVDMDFFLMRSAEAYLISAEADARQNGGVTTAAGTARVNALRERANASTQTQYSLGQILDERSREFYFEGYRRTDLIRFGYYGGSKSSEYLWEWKGGAGTSGVSFPDYLNIYAIPDEDMNANPNLTQNPGY